MRVLKIIENRLLARCKYTQYKDADTGFFFFDFERMSERVVLLIECTIKISNKSSYISNKIIELSIGLDPANMSRQLSDILFV